MNGGQVGRVRLYLSVVRRRIRPAPTPPVMDCDEAQASIIFEAQRKLYTDGVMDGMKIPFELLLGIESSGGQVFEGELPDDVRAWAQTALRAIKGVQT